MTFFNQSKTENVIVGERFVRGVPMLAPLLFAEIATLGLFILLDPDETPKLKEYVHLTGQVQ